MTDTKIVVVEIEVASKDTRAISEIAADLSNFTLLSIGYKQVKPAVLPGPVYRGKPNDMVEATREAIGRS